MIKGELYELIGWGWRFPIIVELLTGGDVCGVTIPNIPILKSQREAVVKLLQTHKTGREGDHWYYTKVGLAKIAQPSAANDPEDVVAWKVDETERLMKADFVVAYCESRYSMPGLRRPLDFALTWDSIRKHMLNWLLSEKELDLGFAILNAFPARANWKNCVIGRHVARDHNVPIGTSVANKNEIKRMLHQNFVSSWDPDTMLSNWSLDITPTRIFHAVIHEQEKERLHKARGNYYKYAWQILRLLKNHTYKGRMYEVILAYSKEAQRPIAKLPHGFVPGSESEGKKPEIVAQPLTSWLQTPVVIGKSMEDGSAYAVVPKDEGMPSVPDIRPEDEDVREPNDDMDSSREGAD